MNTDRTTFEQIHEALESFQAHSLSLSDLIERVPALVKHVGADTPWKDEFVGYWWTLENVHEEAIEAGEGSRLPQDRRRVVDDAIINMQRLVDGALTTSSVD